ncbi:MAG: cobyric acid synthase [Synergistaceae bacterium]|jgi:adenosylcobyric acid synthase|nr:cobyric acid synthase [Synergistaceae bacterium]
MKGIMIQGTSSDAGKSFLVTGLCRVFSDRGYRVCPFKSQNMSNNSYVTKDGLEMGRAQAVQAEAARLDPQVFMNPILLKPRNDATSAIVLMGQECTDARADYYRAFTMNEGLSTVRAALAHIEKNFEAVLIEGAGSPVEINLNATEIVNMRVAREADVPVILTADVDRGGALAALVGTLDLLEADRDRVKGIIFNKFRGNLSLFEPAVRWTEERTGVKVLGVMPWTPARIASEDSLSIRWNARSPKGFLDNEIDNGINNRINNRIDNRIDNRIGSEGLVIGVIRLPYISNHTDLEAFEAEPDVELIEVDTHTSLRRVDAVILPGTKSTVLDMKVLRDSGLAGRLLDFHQRGGYLFGLCGGYQMLGQYIDDRYLRDNDTLKEIEGLGLLPVVTTFGEKKTTRRREGWTIHPLFTSNAARVEGYEIHFGETRSVGEGRGDGLSEKERFYPLFVLNGYEDGMADRELRVAGTYLHNAFHNDIFRAFWLNALRKSKGLPERSVTDTTAANEEAYDVLAARMREHIDIDYIFTLSGLLDRKEQ